MTRALINPTTLVLRWYRQSIGQPRTRQPYTSEEVLHLLHPTDNDPSGADTHPDATLTARSAAVRQVASRPAAWLGEITKQQRQEIGALADRLPSLVFHHTTGADPVELVRRYGGWSSWRYERALEVAGTCIASHLNHAPVLA
jgi:hypothetical protein